MLALTIATLGVNVLLFLRVPKGFFPEQDTGRLMGIIRAAQGTSFQAMRAQLTSIVDITRKDPDVEYVIGFTGGAGGGSTTNTARIMISLKPFGERTGPIEQVIARLRPQLAKVSGAPTYLQAVQDIRIGGRLANAEFQYTLKGDDPKELNIWAERIVARLQTQRQLVDVSSDQQNQGLQAALALDRVTASRLGITPQVLDDILYDAFGQRQVAITYTSLNQYHVVLEVAPRFWQHPDSLRDIYVPSASGGAVPLSAVTRQSVTTTALAVNHQGQFPSVTASFNLASGAALGDAVQAIEAVTREVRPPGSIRGSFQGTAQAFQASLKDEPLLILAALVAVYLVLGILYESTIHPITIISTLPSAGVGAVLALLIFRTELTIIAIIGIVLLVGIVKKNGILIVDFALEVERTGRAAPDAIYEACRMRFRPIMMTTLAALLGALPLALGRGVGGELRRPLGLTIVGGLLVSQVLTLYTTPVIYLYLDRLGAWLRRRRAPRPAGAPA
jgi:multidrug efflux pump